MAHMFRLWPPDIEAAPEANSFAADYEEPGAAERDDWPAADRSPGRLRP